jgi:hypothetical protein
MQSDHFSRGSPVDHSSFLSGMRNGAPARTANPGDSLSEPPCIKLGVSPRGGRCSCRPRATQPYDTLCFVTSFSNEFITGVMGWCSPIEWTLGFQIAFLVIFHNTPFFFSDVHLLQMQIHYCQLNHTTGIIIKTPDFFFSCGFRSVFAVSETGLDSYKGFHWPVKAQC